MHPFGCKIKLILFWRSIKNISGGFFIDVKSKYLCYFNVDIGRTLILSCDPYAICQRNNILECPKQLVLIIKAKKTPPDYLLMCDKEVVEV